LSNGAGPPISKWVAINNKNFFTYLPFLCSALGDAMLTGKCAENYLHPFGFVYENSLRKV